MLLYSQTELLYSTKIIITQKLKANLPDIAFANLNNVYPNIHNSNALKSKPH